MTVKVVWAIRQSGRACTIFHELPQLISLHVFDDDTVAKITVSKANLKLFGLVGVWARPRSLLLRCFALWRNANLAGGFAGRSWSCFLFGLFCFS